ncbi:hypothetical protein [Tenacibaculum sp. 190524A02b]|uniref:hypothetical protein n=1 Tax=Tenacibaculum vairaonense TaxID=3137860 RepID=UPI0031FB3001
MKKYVFSIFVILVIIFNSSCRKDFTTIPSFGNLEFSRDTVFLDTIFTNIGSATYNLKVYNRSDQSITIPSIKLENGVNSNYRLNVDGTPGKEFKDIDLLANDSLYVFIETTIDFNSITDPLYIDKILFDNGNNQQDVDLVTLVQDAHFIFPYKTYFEPDQIPLSATDQIQGRFLKDSELNFTAEKPYVIYGYAAVPPNKTLTIEEGAQIHFHKNSGIIVYNDASIKANGTLDKKITFQGDRLEHRFDNIPGQWGTIWMRSGSKDNELTNIILKNGTIGLRVDGTNAIDTPTLTIKNSEIYNNSLFGMLGVNGNIKGENLVVANAGQSSFASIIGGVYNFTHATFANYWRNGLRKDPTVWLSDYFVSKDDNGQDVINVGDLAAANFTNCIIEGDNNVELLLDQRGSGLFNYNIKNCMFQFEDLNDTHKDNIHLNFEDITHYQNNIINGTPDFKNPSENEFFIGKNSDAINKAISTPLTLDLLGTDRASTPDIGAYQNSDF